MADKKSLPYNQIFAPTPKKYKTPKKIKNTKKFDKSLKSTKFERTSTRTANVHMEDGSSFEVTSDDPRKLDSFQENPKNVIAKLTFSVNFGSTKPHKVLSNEDRRRMGIEQDESLEDYIPDYKP